MASARPQEYDDYDQPTPRSLQRHQLHHQQHISSRKHQDEERETTTVIPIIQYDKEQDINGNYKTRYAHFND